MSPEHFKPLALEKLSFLEQFGFLREPAAEVTDPTLISLVYKGKHVAFIISYDIRDKIVYDLVVRVKNGKMLIYLDEGGYHSSIWGHLVRYEGLRRTHRAPRAPNTSQMEAELDDIVELLKQAGNKLLLDDADSLPSDK
jgi:hypothetical protein